MGGHSILVNYWYANAVGHAIEGMRYSLGYQRADPSARVSLLLNGATPAELPSCCSFIETTYLVPFTHFMEVKGNPRAALAGLPREWDWVLDNHRTEDPSQQLISGFRRFYDATHDYFAPRLGTGVTGASPPAYEPHHQLRLELPEGARRAAAAKLNGRRAISVVLAGHSDRRAYYPSATSWELILRELGRRFPEAVFCLIGRSGRMRDSVPERSGVLSALEAFWSGRSGRRRDPRSTTTIASAEVERIAASSSSINCFDLPVLLQLAIVEASALFISPHTGFGFATVAVGTPWLAISGGHWHEYFFNGVPFYSVLPDTKRYPCFTQDGPRPPLIESDEDGEGPRAPSMSSARLSEDLPELLDAAEVLIDGRLSYDQALEEYFPRLLAAYRGDRSRIFSFDNIHRSYI
jgi:hypothetical protein